jgi:hypothetical protein
LYRVQSQNYPYWGGEHLIHDPTLTIFFDEVSADDTTPPPSDPDPPDEPPEDPGNDIPPERLIFGYELHITLFCIGIVAVFIIVKQAKKRKI